MAISGYDYYYGYPGTPLLPYLYRFLRMGQVLPSAAASELGMTGSIEYQQLDGRFQYPLKVPGRLFELLMRRVVADVENQLDAMPVRPMGIEQLTELSSFRLEPKIDILLHELIELEGRAGRSPTIGEMRFCKSYTVSAGLALMCFMETMSLALADSIRLADHPDIEQLLKRERLGYLTGSNEGFQIPELAFWEGTYHQLLKAALAGYVGGEVVELVKRLGKTLNVQIRGQRIVRDYVYGQSGTPLLPYLYRESFPDNAHSTFSGAASEALGLSGKFKFRQLDSTFEYPNNLPGNPFKQRMHNFVERIGDKLDAMPVRPLGIARLADICASLAPGVAKLLNELTLIEEQKGRSPTIGEMRRCKTYRVLNGLFLMCYLEHLSLERAGTIVASNQIKIQRLLKNLILAEPADRVTRSQLIGLSFWHGDYHRLLEAVLAGYVGADVARLVEAAEPRLLKARHQHVMGVDKSRVYKAAHKVQSLKVALTDIPLSGELVTDIKHLLKTGLGMKDQHVEMVCMRYGLSTGIPMTFNAIGKHYNISHERVRQIVNEAELVLGYERIPLLELDEAIRLLQDHLPIDFDAAAILLQKNAVSDQPVTPLAIEALTGLFGRKVRFCCDKKSRFVLPASTRTLVKRVLTWGNKLTTHFGAFSVGDILERLVRPLPVTERRLRHFVESVLVGAPNFEVLTETPLSFVCTGARPGNTVTGIRKICAFAKQLDLDCFRQGLVRNSRDIRYRRKEMDNLSKGQAVANLPDEVLTALILREPGVLLTPNGEFDTRNVAADKTLITPTEALFIEAFRVMGTPLLSYKALIQFAEIDDVPNSKAVACFSKSPNVERFKSGVWKIRGVPLSDDQVQAFEEACQKSRKRKTRSRQS